MIILSEKEPTLSTDICILGIVNEKPRHGYEIEKIIDHRGIRNWVDIRFSSVYNTLSRLERKQNNPSGPREAQRGSLQLSLKPREAEIHFRPRPG
ncbi:MAG: PadR family transcriptional regulator [Candidatus Freyarchaeota archaeon]